MKELEEWLMEDHKHRYVEEIGPWGFPEEFRVRIRRYRHHAVFGYGSTLSEAAINAIAAEKAENG